MNNSKCQTVVMNFSLLILVLSKKIQKNCQTKPWHVRWQNTRGNMASYNHLHGFVYENCDFTERPLVCLGFGKCSLFMHTSANFST